MMLFLLPGSMKFKRFLIRLIYFDTYTQCCHYILSSPVSEKNIWRLIFHVNKNLCILWYTNKPYLNILLLKHETIVACYITVNVISKKKRGEGNVFWPEQF